MSPAFSTLHIARKWLVAVGAGLVVSAAALLLAELAGVLPAEFLAAGGHSALRTVANLAVGGCLCIAIGFWDQ
ncbi:MAG: hypothetical protein L6Q83_13730 [Gammaproteobacteria bacterium]|nr:hypothetical protein [Gammaproteobacteria bacterium]